MYLQKIITDRVKEIMRSKGITQHALAMHMDSDDAAISRFLNPNGNITLRTLERIEEVLGESVLPFSTNQTQTHEIPNRPANC